MSILIKNVLLGNKRTHIYIEDNIISETGKILEADRIIDGSGKAALPGFINTHTHAAMTLFRGYADDMPLHEWLEKKIWPVEARLNEEFVYWGTKLACLEMIKSGTVAFNDMYHFQEGAVKAVEECGMRAMMGPVFLDLNNPEKREKEIKRQERFFRLLRNLKSERIKPCLNPHSVYAVSKECLEWCVDFSKENDLPVHIHVSETKKENDEFIKKTGKTPVEFLEEIGLLNGKVIAAHCVWLSHQDIEILSRHDVTIAHCPVSNMKLSVGRVMPYHYMQKLGLNITLGTDGCASNNNLDMFETMKFASLLHKHHVSQTSAPANEIFKMATENGAKALGINAGKIEEGKLADIILIDLNRPDLVPNHNLISNIIYSANSSCVDTVIVDGKILMEGRKVPGEEEILENAKRFAEKLFYEK